MSDAVLRQAQRTCQVQYLVERMRTGLLDCECIKLAARLGHPVALQLYPGSVQWTGRVIGPAEELIGPEAIVRFGVECVERIPELELTIHGVAREALAAAHEWAACPCESHARAADGAALRSSLAGYRIGDGHANSMAIPLAAASAAFAASSLHPALGHVAANISSAVSRAAVALGMGAGESEWQRLRLAQYVLGEVE